MLEERADVPIVRPLTITNHAGQSAACARRRAAGGTGRAEARRGRAAGPRPGSTGPAAHKGRPASRPGRRRRSPPSLPAQPSGPAGPLASPPPPLEEPPGPFGPARPAGSKQVPAAVGLAPGAGRPSRGEGDRGPSARPGRRGSAAPRRDPCGGLWRGAVTLPSPRQKPRGPLPWGQPAARRRRAGTEAGAGPGASVSPGASCKESPGLFPSEPLP